MITHKDPRYSLPALVYMAVLGTGWIATAKRWRPALTGAFVVVVLINLVGVSTGTGGIVRITLPGAPKTASVLAERSATLYSPEGWVRGGPEHDGDVLALLRGLKRIGVRDVTFDAGSSNDINFNISGLQVLAIEAGLPVTDVYNPGGLGPKDAFVLRHTLEPGPASLHAAQRRHGRLRGPRLRLHPLRRIHLRVPLAPSPALQTHQAPAGGGAAVQLASLSDPGQDDRGPHRDG